MDDGMMLKTFRVLAELITRDLEESGIGENYALDYNAECRTLTIQGNAVPGEKATVTFYDTGEVKDVSGCLTTVTLIIQSIFADPSEIIYGAAADKLYGYPRGTSREPEIRNYIDARAHRQEVELRTN